MYYNPFNKGLREPLEKADLDELVSNSVTEGYYVEFKEEFPKNEKVARSIASFANTYGGWYVVGIRADKTNNRAIEVSGFDFAQTNDPIAKVRDIIKSHIDPIPLFFPRVVVLEEDRAVLVVYIPSNQETPFVCKDGRIYRREADSSEPVSEANRYALDKLVENGKRIHERFFEFCKDERCFAKFENDLSWLNIYLYPFPDGSVETKAVLSDEDLDRIVESSKALNSVYIFDEGKIQTHIPFNTFRLANKSVILEQHKPEHSAFNNLTAEIFDDGRAKFHIPIDKSSFDFDNNFVNLSSAVAKEVLRNLWESDAPERQSNVSTLKLFRFADLCAAVISLLSFYREVIGDRQSIGEIRFAIELNNVWRLVAFQDSDAWGLHTQKYGLPVVKSETIVFPDRDESRFLNLANKFFWARPIAYLGFAFGLTADFIDSAYAKYYIDFAQQYLQSSESSS